MSEKWRPTMKMPVVVCRVGGGVLGAVIMIGGVGGACGAVLLLLMQLPKEPPQWLGYLLGSLMALFGFAALFMLGVIWLEYSGYLARKRLRYWHDGDRDDA